MPPVSKKTFSFKIPDTKWSRAKAAFLKVFPNNETKFPDDWQPNPEKPRELPPQVPKYSDRRWISVVMRRIFLDVVRKGEVLIAREEAEATLPPVDDVIDEV